MAAIRFYPKKERSGRYSIVCIVSDGTGQEQPKSLGYTIDNKIKHWNKNTQRAKGCEQATDINAKISQWDTRYQEYAGKVKREDEPFILDDAIKVITAGKSAKKSRRTVSGIWNDFVEFKRKTTSAGNAHQYTTAFEDFEKFEKYTDYQYKLSDITTEFYLDYGLYLAEEKDNINSTINKKISRFVTLMDWGFDKGFIDTQHYKKTFFFESHDSGRFPLTWAEISLLENYTPETDFQKLVLKAFLFACETGLRVSDLMQLQPHNLRSMEDNGETINYLDIIQTKGRKHNYVPLSDKAMVMLSDETTGSIFGFKYSQSANVALKKIAKAAKCDRMIEIVYSQGNTTHKIVMPLHKIISFHFARNTYISLMLAAGLQPVFVQGNVAHAELTTTMIYNKQDVLVRLRETVKLQNTMER